MEVFFTAAAKTACGTKIAITIVVALGNARSLPIAPATTALIPPRQLPHAAQSAR
jgi:hypothetical protein